MKKTVAVNDHADYNSRGSYGSKSTGSGGMIAIAAIVALVIGGAGGFFAGYQVGGKSDGNSSQLSQQNGMSGGPNGMMGGGQFGMGGLGTVTAVSDSSITIKDQRQDEETTYTITSDTQVTDDGDDASVSDIKVGDTVMVQSSDDSDSDSKTATSISLNPSFGGRTQNSQSDSSDSSTQSNI